MSAYGGRLLEAAQVKGRGNGRVSTATGAALEAVTNGPLEWVRRIVGLVFMMVWLGLFVAERMEVVPHLEATM